MKKGFTLIELLIVIVIIGVLSTLLMANFVGVRARARDGVRKGDLRQIQQALELYRTDDQLGQYPSALPTCGTAFQNSNQTYMKKIPCDPVTNTGYYYIFNSTTKTYKLVACLENANDGEKTTVNPDTGTTFANNCVYYVLENP